MKVTAIALILLPGGILGFTNSFHSPRNGMLQQVQGQDTQRSSQSPICFKHEGGIQKKSVSPNTRMHRTILMMAVPLLENWTITSRGEASGVVKNHPDPNILDGELLTTSKLSTKADQLKDGATVVTASGSKYRLGKKRGAPVSAGFKFGSFAMGSKSAEVAPPKTPPRKGLFSSRSASGKYPILDQWVVTNRGGVRGVVRNHPDPDISNGDTITTSRIREDRNAVMDGQIVTTNSGSKYTLGKKKGAPSAASKGGIFRSKSKALQDAQATSASSVSAADESTSSSFSMMGTFEMISKKVTRSFPSSSNKKDVTIGANGAKSPSTTKSNVKEEAARIASLRDLKLKYGINGKTVGNGKYLLCERAKRSTSGKSNIWSAYRADKDGMPVGEKLTIKVSTNFGAISRESDNYNRVCSGLFPGRFVEKAEFLPETDGNPSTEFKQSCALVIESGRKDLKAILAERGGRGFEGKAMRDAASAALQCIRAMHSSGIVWTDLKTENFVIVSEEIGDNGNLPGVKGIDLESAMPKGDNPVDFSPEACPPEFASAFINGEGLSFRLEYSYDIWSYGMMLYELTTGRSYFGNKTPAQITKSLQYTDSFVADVSAVTDSKLRDLISQCLQADPRKRPGVAQLLLHPYFLSTGIGPFGW